MKIYDVAVQPGRIGISALPGGSGDLAGDVTAIAPIHTDPVVDSDGAIDMQRTPALALDQKALS